MKKALLTLTLSIAAAPAVAQQALAYSDFAVTPRADGWYYTLLCRGGDQPGERRFKDVRNVVLRVAGSQRMYLFNQTHRDLSGTYSPAANEGCETFRQ